MRASPFIRLYFHNGKICVWPPPARLTGYHWITALNQLPLGQIPGLIQTAASRPDPRLDTDRCLSARSPTWYRQLPLGQIPHLIQTAASRPDPRLDTDGCLSARSPAWYRRLPLGQIPGLIQTAAPRPDPRLDTDLTFWTYVVYRELPFVNWNVVYM